MPEGRSGPGPWVRPFGVLAARAPLDGRRRVAVLGALAALVAVIGGIDSVTGSELSFGVFYLVPVSLAVPFAGPGRALAIAALSAVVWVLADRQIDPEDASIPVDVLNVVLRFSILAFVVGLLAAVREAMHHSQDSDRRSREFLAFLAHQLRTPVASIGATAQALLGRGQGAEDEEALLRMASESSRLGRLVSSSLRFIRLDQGDEMPKALVDLGPLARAEVERQAGLAEPIEVGFDAAGEQPLVVEASADSLREALGNVLENACRHAESRVVVRARAAGRKAELTVNDDGPGLPPGQEDRAFEPYVTLDGRGGSGLGLTIARRLIATQGGSLRYHRGTFVLTVPLAR